MGTLTVKSSSLSRTADYNDENSGIVMNLNYQLDEATMTLKNISGSIYKTPDQSYSGSFNGNRNGEAIVYSLSEVKLADMPVVYTCLTDIETQINSNGQQEEGGEA